MDPSTVATALEGGEEEGQHKEEKHHWEIILCSDQINNARFLLEKSRIELLLSTVSSGTTESWANFNSMCNSGFVRPYTTRAPPTHSIRILTASQTAAPCSTGPRNNRASHRNSTGLRYACRRACHFAITRRFSTFRHTGKIITNCISSSVSVLGRHVGSVPHLLCLLLA